MQNQNAKGGGIRGVQLGKYKMKPPSHKNTPKNQVKAQVQHEYYCCNIQYMMVEKLNWKQSSEPHLDLSVSHLHVVVPRNCLKSSGIFAYQLPAPVRMLQIYCKNKELGNFGRRSLPCPEKSSDSAH